MTGLGKVAVLMGGPSAEREISFLSGNAVLAALVANGVDAHAFDPKERPLTDLPRDRQRRLLALLAGIDRRLHLLRPRLGGEQNDGKRRVRALATVASACSMCRRADWSWTFPSTASRIAPSSVSLS